MTNPNAVANALDSGTTARILFGRELLSQLKPRLFLGGTVQKKFTSEGKSLFGTVRVPNLTIPEVQKRTKNSGDVNVDPLVNNYIDVTLTEYAILPMQIDSLDAIISDIDYREQSAQRAAYKVAKAVEIDLASLYTQVYNIVGDPSKEMWDTTQSPNLATKANALLDEVGADEAPRYGAISSFAKESALNNPLFTQYNTAGPLSTLETGALGRRFGINWGLATQVARHAASGGQAGTVKINNVSGYGIGDSSIAVDGFTAGSGVVEAGTVATISGNNYVVTADATISGNAATFLISPALKTTAADELAVTFVTASVTDGARQNLIYLPESIALATAAITDARPGIENSLVVDEQTGFSIRVMYAYLPKAFSHFFSVEFLYGFKLLRPELIVRAASLN